MLECPVANTRVNVTFKVKNQEHFAPQEVQGNGNWNYSVISLEGSARWPSRQRGAFPSSTPNSLVWNARRRKARNARKHGSLFVGDSVKPRHIRAFFGRGQSGRKALLSRLCSPRCFVWQNRGPVFITFGIHTRSCLTSPRFVSTPIPRLAKPNLLNIRALR